MNQKMLKPDFQLQKNKLRNYIMERQYDAIVIGSGIIGCCTAFELAKKGYKTLNIDKLASAGDGSTSDTCAIIRFHYSTPDGVAMAREGYFYWLNWGHYLGIVDPAGMAKYINTGCMLIKTDRNKFGKNFMQSMDELGVVYQELTAEQMEEKLAIIDSKQYGPPVRQDDPGFGTKTADSLPGAVYIPETGYINDARLSTQNVQKACEARGGEFLYNTEVTDVLKKDGRVDGVELKDGTKIYAPIVVNVAGPHSFQINQMADVISGMNISTRPLRVEVSHVPSPEGFDYNNLGMMITDGDVGNYSRPEVGNNVLIGSEEPDCDDLDWIDNPDDYNQNLTDQWSLQVMRQAQRLKGLPIPQSKTQGLVSLYDCSDDWIPIYDKSDLPGFYMAIGTSGNQYKNAPAVGVMMAQLIAACETGHDHDKEPVTYEMEFTKRPCNISFYSRLRKVNKNSSFSVVG
jgi:glycine/D-amino acid oxidase-like deaminating enzyme